MPVGGVYVVLLRLDGGARQVGRGRPRPHSALVGGLRAGGPRTGVREVLRSRIDGLRAANRCKTGYAAFGMLIPTAERRIWLCVAPTEASSDPSSGQDQECTQQSRSRRDQI